MKKSFKNAFAIGFGLALLSSSAYAALLKTDHTIQSEVLTLEHVFDGLKDHHDYVLGPAPAPGKYIKLNAYTLNQVAASFGLEWRTSNPYETLKVTRDATVVSAMDVKEALTQYAKNNLSLGDFELSLANNKISFILDAAYSNLIEVEDIEIDARRKRFSAIIKTADDHEKTIVGRLTQMTEIPVLSRKMRHGDVITHNDIMFIRVDRNDLSHDTVINENELIGMTPRRQVFEDELVQKADLQAPIIVKKGDQVTMKLAEGRLNVATKGRALDNGAKGDVIRILNQSSNRIIEARVTNALEVSVKSQENTIF